MPQALKEALETVKKQIAEHRRAEARPDSKTIEERRQYMLNDNNPLNATFPWLCANFVNNLVGGEKDPAIPPGILNVVYLYKIMEQLSTGPGFTTYLGVMRRNDLWCNIRTYTFGQAKNISYLAHKEAKISAIVSESRFFDSLITCFKTLTGFYIVKNYISSTPLHNFIKTQERFNDEELRFYAEEIVCAIDFLHSKGIIHRDLSASNINLVADGHIQVVNLQNAYLAGEENLDRSGNLEVEGAVGMDAYMPPEMVNHKLYSYSVDWWNFGVILYFMMNGTMPFQGNTKRELHRNIMFTEPKFEPGLHSTQTHDLVKGFLEKNPKKRIGSEGSRQVFAHEYFRKTNWSKVLRGQNMPPFLPETSAVTCLPSALCVSLDHLNLNEPTARSMSRRDLEKMQIQNISPEQFVEFELEHDWAIYLQRHVPLETAEHYIHSELKPPKNDDENLSLEECITRIPELSPEEKEVFRSYLDDPTTDAAPLEPRRTASGHFQMLLKDKQDQFKLDREGYVAESWSAELLKKYTYPEDSHGFTPDCASEAASFSSKILQSEEHSGHDFGNFLKPSDALKGPRKLLEQGTKLLRGGRRSSKGDVEHSSRASFGGTSRQFQN